MACFVINVGNNYHSQIQKFTSETMNTRYQNPGRYRFAASVRLPAGCLLTLLAFAGSVHPVRADGFWSITQLPIQNVHAPVINNSGEVVWYLDASGIYSSTRGHLATSGLKPHLANSGEVVYEDYFGTAIGMYDLVSTTRGRLTFGGAIGVNSTYDVNSSGEIVYMQQDASGNNQIFSTTRGQITFDDANHYAPCINDYGEIIWGQYIAGVGSVTVSSTRGVLPENYGFYPYDLNNPGDICFDGSLVSPTAGYTSPHIFSSTHGPLINNADLYQWDGGMNDAGAIVWDAPVQPGSSTWYVYEGQWVVPEPSSLALVSLGGLFLLGRALVRRSRFTAQV